MILLRALGVYCAVIQKCMMSSCWVFLINGASAPLPPPLKTGRPQNVEMNIASPPWAKYRSYSNGPSARPACGYRLAYINQASCGRALGLRQFGSIRSEDGGSARGVLSGRLFFVYLKS